MRLVFFSACLMTAMLVFHPSGNAQWGDVEMTFLYDGKPPEAKAIVGARDGIKIVDETWVVGKDGGVKNVVVRLLPEKDVKLPIHPDFEKAKGTSVRVDIVGGYFEPRVAIKYTNQDLTFSNLNLFGHAVRADLSKNSPFNVLVQANKLVTLEAEKNGLHTHDPAVGTLTDNIHPEMRGYLFIHSPLRSRQRQPGESNPEERPRRRLDLRPVARSGRLHQARKARRSNGRVAEGEDQDQGGAQGEQGGGDQVQIGAVHPRRTGDLSRERKATI